ncbi:hypothetical protein GCM10027318_13910 [Massilia agilis]
MRDEPGIGAFVVQLRLDRVAQPRALSAAEIARLREGRRIVAERARALFVLRTALPPPMHGATEP